MSKYIENVNDQGMRQTNSHIKPFHMFGVLTSIVLALFIILSDIPATYGLIALLPLSYAVGMIFSFNLYQNPVYAYSIGFWAVNIFLFIRYVLMVFFTVITGSYSGIGPEPDASSIDNAILLMVYELLWIFIAINTAVYSLANKKPLERNSHENDYSILGNYTVVTIFAVLALVILINFPGLLVPQDLFILSEDYDKVFLDVAYEGALVIISNALKITVLLLILAYCNNKYKLYQTKRYVYISALSCLMYMALMTSTSRWDMITGAVVSLFVLYKLYGKLVKPLIVVFGAVCTISFISISMYKFWWALIYSQNMVSDALIFMLGQFQYYFSGPWVVAQSIDIKDYFSGSINFQTLINDFVGSVPIVSNIVDQDNRINALFNFYNFGIVGTTPLIMPMVGIGYNYFGTLFAPVFTAICEFIAIRLDYQISNEKRIEFVFILSMFIIFIAMCIGFNTQIVFGTFVIKLLPMLVLLNVNRKVSL